MLIFLIGFMGCGKTTLGRKLAKKLKYKFIDTDILIEKYYNKKISQIFYEIGETEFRKTESAILQNTLSEKNCIISTGGGLPCYKNNMDIMNTYGLTIFIQMSPKMLASRLSQKPEKRPLLKNLSTYKEILCFVEGLLNNRKHIYNKAKLNFTLENENFEDLITKINLFSE